MQTFKIAHLKEQGQDLVIIPLEPDFANKSANDQLKVRNALQICATSAKLAGRVAVVWHDGGQFRFLAPPEWQPFFQSITWEFIAANLNKELTCG